MDEIMWAILFVAFVITEFATVQLVSVWFACGALITLICTHFFDIPPLGQLGIFIITSAVFLALTFPIVKKRLNTARTATNDDLNIGQSATVIEEINKDKGTGRVTLNGVDWSAVPENPNDVISKDCIVTVKKVSGSKLIVAIKTENTVSVS